MNGLTVLNKNDIDREVSRQYNDLLKIAKGYILKYGRCFDPETVLHETYFHLIERQEKIKEGEDVRRFAIKYMRDSMKWDNSELNRKTEDTRKKEVPFPEVYRNEVEDESDLNDKVKEEMNEVAFKVFSSHYRSEQKDPVKRIVFENYTQKGANSVRKMATKFNISRSAAERTIREMQKDVRAFAEMHGYNFY